MGKIMDALHSVLEPIFSTKWFGGAISATMFLNPVALAPQVYSVATTSSVAGVSVPMWVLFAAIQAAFVLHAVKTRSAGMFGAMLVSLIESTTIIVVVLARS